MKQLFFAVTILLFSACSDSGVEKPERLVDEDTMVNIFYDLSLIDAMKSHSPDVIYKAKDAKNYIYKKYKIDSLQFAQNNRYYASDIAKYKRMYRRVGERLNRKKAALDSLVNKKEEAKTKLPEQGGVIK